jgi:hypothetical protein
VLRARPIRALNGSQPHRRREVLWGSRSAPFSFRRITPFGAVILYWSMSPIDTSGMTLPALGLTHPVPRSLLMCRDSGYQSRA